MSFLAPNENEDINIPSILIVPLIQNLNNQIVIESNNLESENLQEIIEQGIQTGIKLVKLTSVLPGPIVIPLIPSKVNYPYLQQLSRECFDLSSEDKYYRIDEQLVRIIDKAKTYIMQEKGLVLKDKIFLNGYSSSGVFAQRFALLHPDIVETACIGGAVGSIPIPTEKFDYPIGIANYEILTGRNFDLENYTKIKFRYFVGEFETKELSNSIIDDFGQPAPMHDMSYFEKSVPRKIGIQQHSILGSNLFSRAESSVQILHNFGINVHYKLILGRVHNDNSPLGVNELGDKFVADTYKSTIEERKKFRIINQIQKKFIKI